MARDLDTLKKTLWEHFETASKDLKSNGAYLQRQEKAQTIDALSRLAGRIIEIETEQRIKRENENNNGGVLKGLKQE